MSDVSAASIGFGPSGESPTRRIKVIRPPAFSPLAMILGFRTLWEYRDLLYTLSLHRIKVRYKQSTLGFAWALLQPLSLMAIYTLIFSVVTRMPSEGIPYPIFVYAALLPWTLFSTSLMSSATSMVSHSNLITKVYFPREILPLTYVLAAIFDFLIACVVLAGFMAYYHLKPSSSIFYVFPAIAVCVTFAVSLSLLFSALQVRFRDIGIAMPLLLQLWMFATPVVYPLSAVPLRFRAWYVLNPLVGVVETFRRAVQGVGPEPYSLLISAVISLVLLPLAYMYFKRSEATMADII